MATSTPPAVTRTVNFLFPYLQVKAEHHAHTRKDQKKPSTGLTSHDTDPHGLPSLGRVEGSTHVAVIHQSAEGSEARRCCRVRNGGQEILQEAAPWGAEPSESSSALDGMILGGPTDSTKTPFSAPLFSWPLSWGGTPRCRPAKGCRQQLSKAHTDPG